MLVAQMMRYGNDAAYYSNKATDGKNYWAGYPMMWGWGNGSGFWFGSIFCIITWVAIIAVLVALVRWLWFKGDREKKSR